MAQLEFNAIKDEGAQALAKGLRANGALKSIRLGNNGVSDEAMSAVASALAQAPEAVAHTASSGGAGGGGGGAPRHAAAHGDDEDDVEEISFDDDEAAAAEAEAEAAAEARERRAAAAATCIDHGPWACEEDNCPSPTLGCAELANLQVCGHRFEEVWEKAPPGMEGKVISDMCARACGQCGKDEL